MHKLVCAVTLALLALSACKPAEQAPAEPAATPASAPSAVASPAASASPANEPFIAIGTEPFWTVKIVGGQATYSTPENEAGDIFVVTATGNTAERQFSGTLVGQPFVLTLRPKTCSDGMSDRTYSLEAVLIVAGDQRAGCGEPGTAFKGE